MAEERKSASAAPQGSGFAAGSENVFLDSLRDMRASDFQNQRRSPKEKGRTRRKSGGIFSTVLLVVCVLVFLYCAGQIVYSLMEDARSDELYDDFSEKYRDAMEPDAVNVLQLGRLTDASPMKTYAQIAKDGADIFNPSDYRPNTVQSVKLQKMLVFLSELKQENPDIFGYISVNGTRINYPVVQGRDNDYYLSHGFDGDTLKAGSIFADWRNSRTLLDNQNTVFYGHNMSTGAMFHDLTQYLDEDFFNTKQIILTTFDGIYTFEVFSIHESLANVNYFQTWFGTDAEFVAFCEQQEALSKYHKEGITFTGESRILTLSTCINSGMTDGRYALHAVLVKTER